LSTAIVTDSTSDIPQKLREDLGIFQIPVDLTLEDKTYLDGFDLSRNDFYDRLPSLKKMPTTAAPASGRFQQLYEEIFNSGYTKIISIHAASTLSGIFNSARLAAQEFKQNVNVVDSEQLSLGMGFQVIHAAKMVRQRIPLDEIMIAIQSIKDRVCVFALLDTFKFIHRSGRVSWTKARLGSMLNIKPIVELEKGMVINRGLARTRTRGIQYLGESIKKMGSLEYLAVLHTNATETGKKFIQDFAPAEIPDPLLVNVTTIIGTHVGPNGIGFAAVVK
jgi:DegV family protein with EDD domain